MGYKFKKVKKWSGNWGQRIGTCPVCQDTDIALERVPGTKDLLCFSCLNDRLRIPAVKRGKAEEDKQNNDWKELTSLGGRN